MKTIKTISKEVSIVKNKLRTKYSRKGFNKDQIQIQMNSLDCEFCTHAFVNNVKLSNNEERLKFYLIFLKSQL